MSFLIYLKAVRAHTLLMTILLTFSCYSYSKLHYSILNTRAFIFVAVSIVLFHLSVNSISEYRDFKKGMDDNKSEDENHMIVTGLVQPKHILHIGVCSFATASLLGLYAVLLSSPVLLISGLIGAGISLFYSEWPFGYKYKALGELGVFLAYGPLLVFSCIYSLTSQFGVNEFLLSISFGLLTTAVLTANNIRDYYFDFKRIKTLATVFGLRWTYSILFFIVHLAFLIIPILIYRRAIPQTCWFVFCAYPILFTSIKKIGTSKFIDVFGILQVAFCVIFCIALQIEFFMMHQ